MRRLIFFTLMFFAVNGCVGAAQDVKAPKKEKADENSYAWDFGKVKQGGVLKHYFILKNDSGKVLTIQSINTSCGCTASKAKKQVLAPKEETAIEVTFNSKGYSGEVTQYVYVNTDSLDKALIRFIIRANVIKN